MFEIYQSEDGDVGSIEETQGGAVCDTPEGAMDSFYVLRVGDRAAEGVDEGEGDKSQARGLELKLKKKVTDHQYEASVETSMMPDLDWSEEEQIEMEEALEATDAWQRYLEEGPKKKGVNRFSEK